MTEGSSGSRRPLGPPLVVLPTERHVERSGGAAVTSARRFFARLWDEVEPERVAASPALLELLAKRAGAQPREGLAVGAGARPDLRAGLGAIVHATLGELARAGTTARDLERARTARGAALASILRDVDRELDRVGRFDPRRTPVTHRDFAARADSLDLPERACIDGTVSLDGGATDAWLEVHRAIRRRGGEGVVLRLPRIAPDEATFAPVADAIEQRLADEPDPFELDWFDVPPVDPSRTAVLEAHGDDAEARAVAAHVRRAIDEGARPDRILVVAPSREDAFIEPLLGALREAGVAASEAWGPSVGGSPEARCVLALVRMAVGRLDRDALVELLHTPGLHPGVLVREREEGHAVERARALASRLAQLPVVQDRDGALFVEALRASMKQDGEGASAETSRDFWMVSAMEKLALSILELRSAGSLEAFVGTLLPLVDRLRLGEPSAPEIARALASDRAEEAMRAIAEGAVAVRAVRTKLTDWRDAHRLLGAANDPLDLGELAMELDLALEGTRTAARGAAGRAGAVRVGELGEALALDHDLVVLTRMAGGAYARAPRGTLLDETTRRALPPGARPRAARERAAIREAEIAWAAASTRALAFSYSSTDREGREAEPPHPRLVAAIGAGAPRRVEPASRAVARASGLCDRGRLVSSIAAGGLAPAAILERAAVEQARQAFFSDPAVPAGPYSGRIPEGSTPLLVERMGGASPSRPVAVTALERAFQCPFRAFADRVLRARKVEDMRDIVGPRERGEMLHLALHEAFEEDKKRRDSATVEERLQVAMGVIGRALEVDATASPLRREGRKRAAADALYAFADDLDREDDYLYREGERAFGRELPPPFDPLPLEAPSGEKVYVEGRIDRVDEVPGGERVRIVDYKTGKPRSKRAQVGQFQLPLYGLVAKRAGAREVSAMYVCVGLGGAVELVPAKPSDRVVSDDEMKEAEASAAASLTRIWSGDIAPRPVSGSVCRTCDARDLCRRPQVIAETSSEDEP